MHLGLFMALVTNGNGAHASAPTVSAISPNKGALGGGTAVTITGTGFVTGCTVKIGGTSCTSVVFVNSTSVTAVTPAKTAGAKDVVVTNPDAQTGTLTNGFTYAFMPKDVTSATLALWYRADLGVTDSSGVTDWLDQSGVADTAKHLTASGTAKPTLNATDPAYGNKSTVSFNGTTQWMHGGVLASPITQPSSHLIVGEMGGGVLGYLTGGTLAARNGLTQDSGNKWAMYAGGVGDTDATSTTTSPHKVAAVFDGNSSKIFVDDFSTAQGTGGTGSPGTNSMTEPTMGSLDNSGSGLAFAAGKIAEYIVYEGTLSAPDLAALQGYFLDEYGF